MKILKFLGVTFMASSVIFNSNSSSFQLESPAFKNKEKIDKKYTCQNEDGENISPKLIWENSPKNTEFLALLVEDPDAPQENPWVHWVIFNIPKTQNSLDQDFSKQADLSTNITQGTNSFKTIGYKGPCPPAGESHRYYFKLYALDTKLDLKSGATKEDLLNAIKGHILDQAELMGTYKKQ